VPVVGLSQGKAPGLLELQIRGAKRFDQRHERDARLPDVGLEHALEGVKRSRWARAVRRSKAPRLTAGRRSVAAAPAASSERDSTCSSFPPQMAQPGKPGGANVNDYPQSN